MQLRNTCNQKGKLKVLLGSQLHYFNIAFLIELHYFNIPFL